MRTEFAKLLKQVRKAYPDADEDLLRYITNVYRVLMSRGMRGTYLYVVDPLLRERLRRVLG